ncbi:hypothetical protein [Novosphingobium sp. AP12]|nr:hypothetical protein [Novosphingobium sp. AP12]
MNHLRQDGFAPDTASLFGKACAVILPGCLRSDNRLHGNAAPMNAAFA